MTKPVIVTLVHGTGAKNADWVMQDNTVLRKELRERLGSEVLIRSFNWSGSNSHGARIIAGKELATDQAELAVQYPMSSRFVICHSHGGNVALYAAGHLKEGERLTGIITLATPFIHCVPRDIGRSRFFLRLLTAFVCGILGLFLGMYAYVFTFVILDSWFHFPRPPFFPGLLPSLFFVKYGWDVYIRIERRLQNLQTRIISELQPPPTETPLFCLYVAGDEAGMWLSLAAWTGDRPYWLWSKRAAVSLVIFTALSLALRVADNNKLSRIRGHRTDAEIVGPLKYYLVRSMLPILGLFEMAIVLLIVMAVLPKIVRAHPFAFGGESILHNLVVRIFSRPLPTEQNSDIESKRFPIRYFSWGLRHSWLYSDSEVANEIGCWIAKRTAGV